MSKQAELNINLGDYRMFRITGGLTSKSQVDAVRIADMTKLIDADLRESLWGSLEVLSKVYNQTNAPSLSDAVNELGTVGSGEILVNKQIELVIKVADYQSVRLQAGLSVAVDPKEVSKAQKLMGKVLLADLIHSLWFTKTMSPNQAAKEEYTKACGAKVEARMAKLNAQKQGQAQQ